MSDRYLNNINLPRAGLKHNWTLDMVEEFKRCSEDSIYFAEKYIKIVHVDKGFIPIELYDYQKEIIRNTYEVRNNIVCTSRQAGKCHSAETKYNIRSKKTGEIISVTAEEFHLLVSGAQSGQKSKENNKVQDESIPDKESD